MMVNMEESPILVILDCDGVLIDSEMIATRVEVRELRNLGCALSTQDYLETALGRIEEDVVWQEIADKNGVALPPGFVEKTKRKVAISFEHELQPIEGIHEALTALTFPICVASGSHPKRLKKNLGQTGLIQYFDGNVFSSAQVSRGKPHPDLYLYACDQMGFAPEQCIVVEDSPFGIQGAVAAGMTTLGFTGGSHHTPRLAQFLRESGCTTLFDDMRELPQFCNWFAETKLSGP
jgi:HAD superfamily hydrolase (TIGR01509 family)